MKICLLYDLNEKGGFRNFGDQMKIALERTGCSVSVWDTSPLAPPHFPGDFDRYLLIWHPALQNHYTGATYWPDKGKCAIWIGEVPPYSTCPFLDRFAYAFAADEVDGILLTDLLWYPTQDWIEDLPPANLHFTIGHSGVRGSGLGLLREICDRHGWELNASSAGGRWLSYEEEVARLARSTVNVAWYEEDRQEVSGGVSTLISSGRPLLINDAPMLQHLQPYCSSHDGDRTWCIYGGRLLERTDPEGLEELLLILADRWARKLLIKPPTLAKEDLAWGKMARRLLRGLELMDRQTGTR